MKTRPRFAHSCYTVVYDVSRTYCSRVSFSFIVPGAWFVHRPRICGKMQAGSFIVSCAKRVRIRSSFWIYGYSSPALLQAETDRQKPRKTGQVWHSHGLEHTPTARRPPPPSNQLPHAERQPALVRQNEPNKRPSRPPAAVRHVCVPKRLPTACHSCLERTTAFAPPQVAPQGSSSTEMRLRSACVLRRDERWLGELEEGSPPNAGGGSSPRLRRDSLKREAGEFVDLSKVPDGLRGALAAFDSDNDGVISLEELRRSAARHNVVQQKVRAVAQGRAGWRRLHPA